MRKIGGMSLSQMTFRSYARVRTAMETPQGTINKLSKNAHLRATISSTSALYRRHIIMAGQTSRNAKHASV